MGLAQAWYKQLWDQSSEAPLHTTNKNCQDLDDTKMRECRNCSRSAFDGSLSHRTDLRQMSFGSLSVTSILRINLKPFKKCPRTKKCSIWNAQDQSEAMFIHPQEPKIKIQNLMKSPRGSWVRARIDGTSRSRTVAKWPKHPSGLNSEEAGRFMVTLEPRLRSPKQVKFIQKSMSQWTTNFRIRKREVNENHQWKSKRAKQTFDGHNEGSENGCIWSKGGPAI